MIEHIGSNNPRLNHPEEVAREFNLSVTRVKACAEFARHTA